MTHDEQLAATATATLGLLILTRDKGDDQAGQGEPNTYGLPEGEPIARELRRWLKLQKAAVLEAIPDQGELPERFPDLTADEWTDPMKTAMVPLIGAYWDESGKEVYSRLGLDPDEWKVTNPHLAPQIARQSFSFCSSTNASTNLSLNRALERLRESFTQGLVTEGETLPQLRKRVQEIFVGLSRSHAQMVAATEASRAVHAAQLQADVDSEVVAGLELLLSADACPLCRKVATEARRVLLGQPFAVIGKHPEYATIRHPPIHPHCQCTVIEVLKPEYGGPAHVDWALPLDQPQKGLKDGYTPPEGKKTPEPEPKKAADKPRPTKPPPAAKPEPLDPRILPDRPIAERLKAYTKGDAKVAAVLEADRAAKVEDAAMALERSRINRELNRLNEEGDALARKRAKGKLTVAESDRLLAIGPEGDKLVAERNRIKAQQAALKARARDEALKSLATDNPAKVALQGTLAADPDYRGVVPLSGKTAATAEEARAFYAGLLRRGDADRLEFEVGEIPASHEQRAFYRPSRNLVNLARDGATDVAVHELAHAIEEKMATAGKPALERSLEFLEYRVGDEVPTSMKKLFPTAKYSADEVGRKDHFDRAFDLNSSYYIGKDYGGSGTEILSMGIQKLYTDPVHFAQQDPEYFKFCVGMLDGSLR